MVAITATKFAQAQPADVSAAEALFTSGKEAMSRSDLATACARFADSLKLDPAVGTGLNLAACEERSGRLAAALEHFTAARAQLAKDDFRIAFTSEQIAKLSRRVAHLTLRLPTPPAPETRVVRDGIEVAPAAFNVATIVDPGPHAVVVEARDRSPSKLRITLAEGEEKIVELPALVPSRGGS